MDSISTENGLIGGKRFFRGSKHMIIFRKEKQALLMFKEYIEGQMDFDTFWSEFVKNDYLITVLMRFSKKKKIGGINRQYFFVTLKEKKILIFSQNIYCNGQYVIT